MKNLIDTELDAKFAALFVVAERTEIHGTFFFAGPTQISDGSCTMMGIHRRCAHGCATEPAERDPNERRHPAAGRLTTARCGPTMGTVRLMPQPQVLVPPAQYWQALWLAVRFTAHSRSNTYCRLIPRHRRQYRHPNPTRQTRGPALPNPPRQKAPALWTRVPSVP